MSVFSSHLGGSHGSGHEEGRTRPGHYCSGHGLTAGLHGTNLLEEGVSNEQLVPPTPRAPMRPEAHCATHASARLMAST